MPPGDMFGVMRNVMGLIFAAGALAPGLRAQGTVPGWYQEELEVVGTAGRPAAVRAIVRTYRAGDYMRVERVDEQLPHMAALEYELTNASTHERYRVNVAQKFVMQSMSFAELVATVPDTSQLPKMLERTVEDLGSGGRLLGYQTRRVRERRVSRTRYGPVGQGRVGIDTVVRVMWIATFAANPALAVGVRNPAAVSAAGQPPRGVVMRCEETRVVPRRKVTHLEVRLLERRDLDPRLFVLPASFRRVKTPSAGNP